MTKTVAMIALLQTGFVFSPIARAEDAKPAVAPAAAVAKTDAKDEEHCDCKECAGKHGKKSCKTCKHCKMGHHDKKGEAHHEEAAHES